MLSEEDKEIIKQIGKYKYNQMKDKGFNYEEYLEYLQNKQQEKELRQKMGQYEYSKMKKMGLTYEQYLQYKEQKDKEKKLKQKIGHEKYNELKELGMTLEEYEKFREDTKYKNRQRYEEKNRVRYRTVRYIERYCDLEMKCQICGEKAQIHHPNYNDYLKINLLCKKHHTALHNFELIPPEIIDLEKVAVKKPATEKKKEYMEEQIKNIMKDILENGLDYNELIRKYNVYPQVIKKYLQKQPNYIELENRLKENGRNKQQFRKNTNINNPLLPYKLINNVNSKEISKITEIPLSTIRAIECGKTNINNIRPHTKEKLKKILIKENAV